MALCDEFGVSMAAFYRYVTPMGELTEQARFHAAVAVLARVFAAAGAWRGL